MSDYWTMALDAADDARVLLAAEKSRGATSRAYYAMFDAARAALARVDSELPMAKSHQTIISRFGLHIVVGNGLDPELGRYLNTTEELRITADYDQAEFAIEEARATLVRMEHLLAVIAGLLGKAPP